MGGRFTNDPRFTDEETKAQRGHSAGELQRNDWNLGFSGPATDHILNPWLCSLLLTRGQRISKERNPGRQCQPLGGPASGLVHLIGWAHQAYQKPWVCPREIARLPFYKVCGVLGTGPGATFGLTWPSMGPQWPQHHVGWDAGSGQALALCLLGLCSETGPIRGVISKLVHHGTILFPTSGYMEQGKDSIHLVERKSKTLATVKSLSLPDLTS